MNLTHVLNPIEMATTTKQGLGKCLYLLNKHGSYPKTEFNKPNLLPNIKSQSTASAQLSAYAD